MEQKQLVLLCLRSQGEGAEALELVRSRWEGKGAAVLCSRCTLATTLSRWELSTTSRAGSSPCPPHVLPWAEGGKEGQQSLKESFNPAEMKGIRRSSSAYT